jgi:hypothetical protein
LVTDCVEQNRVRFEGLPKPLEVSFDGPDISSDGGILLLRQLDQRLGISQRIAALVPDTRDSAKVLHPRLEQTRQRLYQIALGYEDGNDAKTLRRDPLFKTACDRLPSDPVDLSSQPTFSRYEGSVQKKHLRSLLLDFEQYYYDTLKSDTSVIVLDIDTSDDPTHGQQEFAFYHGYYRHYMYHPIFIFDGLSGQLITAILRPGNKGASRGAGPVLERIIRNIREVCPDAILLVRGDSAFSTPRLHERIERLDEDLSHIDYLFGQATNARLKAIGKPHLEKAKQTFEQTGQKVRTFYEFQYAAESWNKERRVIGKAEYTSQGANPRFVVTSLESSEAGQWYDAYCRRGQAENYIKDLMNAMAADRLSCQTFEGNFFRLLLHGWAYRLMWSLREEVRKVVEEEFHREALVHEMTELTLHLKEELGHWAERTEPFEPLEAAVLQMDDELEKVQQELVAKRQEHERVGRAQFDTLRLGLLKVAVQARESVRRVWCQLPASFPLAGLFRKLLERGKAARKPG